MHLFGEFRCPGTPHAQSIGHVLEYGHVGPDGIGLEHHRQAAFLGADVDARLRRIDNVAVDADFARGRLLEAGDRAQRGGLAAAGGAEQRQLLAGQDVETDAAHRRNAAVVQFEPVDLDVRFRAGIGGDAA